MQVAILVNSYDETKLEENQTTFKTYLENRINVIFRLDNSEVGRSKICFAEKSIILKMFWNCFLFYTVKPRNRWPVELETWRGRI